MTTWSFDILRQGGFDLWVAVCALGSLVLLTYALVGRLYRRPSGWLALLLVAIGVGGTALVIAWPRLHTPLVGMAWTFILVALLSAVFYLNLIGQLGTGRTSLLLGLRVLALALMVPMLFEPVIRRTTRRPPDRPLAFVIDASGSMSFPDKQNEPPRLQAVWQALRSQVSRIDEAFLPRYFLFGTEVRELRKASELASATADGKATDIVRGVREAVAKVARDKAEVVLVSDGIDNVSPDVAGALAGLGVPVHTVRVGSAESEPAAVANVAVDDVQAADDFVVDHETKVRITVKSTALANRVVEVKLAEVDAQGKPVGKVASRTLVLAPAPEGQVVEVPFKPRVAGVQRLAAYIDPIAGERSVVDNRQEFQGLALDPRIKVLYLEGRARPEFRDLNRALSRDPNVEAASLLRITENRFASSGGVGGEKVERIPTSKEEWSRFDVVILGDLDASFLTQLQQASLEQYVSGGGGLLMIGGQDNFGPGGYAGTSVERALPVSVGPREGAQEKTPFIPALTDEGRAHPAMEGLGEWFTGGNIASTRPAATVPATGPATGPAAGPAAGGRSLPPLKGNVVVGAPKAGASVLLVHRGRPGPNGADQVVLAVHRYGEGRAAAFTADTTYLWYLPLRGMGQDSPYNRFWGQLVRWLAAEDVRNRSRGPGVEGLLNKNLFQLGENVRVRAMVRDERGDATRYAQVNLSLRGPGSAEARQFPLNPVGTRTGLYDVTLPAPDKGEWVAELVATKDGKELGRQVLKFAVIPPAEELLKLAANPALLAEVSRRTGGYHFELTQLRELLDKLDAPQGEGERARVTHTVVPLANAPRALLAWAGAEVAWDPKYDLPVQAALVAVLLAAEWALRRRWQLP